MRSANLIMKFSQNNFDAEKEIKRTLINQMKFTEDIEPKKLRKRFEKRIFTRDRMTWNELVERTATNTKWIWHKPGALEDLKYDSSQKEIWFEDGNYLDKTPPSKKTTVNISRMGGVSEEGVTMLRISPVNADKVYYEIGEEPTTASKKVENYTAFEATDLVYYFLAVDSEGVNETGEPVRWENDIRLKYKEITISGKDALKLQAIPSNCEIKYTTDGSSPMENGGMYKEPIVIPEGAKYIQAVAFNEKYDITSDVLKYEVKDKKVTVDKDKPVKLTEPLTPSDTKYTYEALEYLQETNASIGKAQFIINGRSGSDFSITLMVDKMDIEDMDILEKELTHITDSLVKDQKYDLTAILDEVKFSSGRDFLKWLEINEFNLELYKNRFDQYLY